MPRRCGSRTGACGASFRVWMIRISVTLLLALAFHISPASAQDEGDGVVMQGRLPDTVVVTASRYAAPKRQTGRRVTVLTAEDIRALPVTSYDELLRSVTGVDVRSRGGFGVQSDLSVRGAGFNGVLVLLDGVPINDPQTGHYISELPVPLASVARVEVLRGPATALYGPDALGGVVQIFTHAGLRQADASNDGVEGSVSAQYGAHELYDAGGNVRTSFGKTTVSAATAWQGTDGERVAGASYANGQPIRTDFERRAHTAALARSLGDDASLYARLGMDRRTHNSYHFYTPFPSDRARSRKASYWGQMRVSGQPGARTRWQLNASAKQHEGHYVYSFQPSLGFDGVAEPADTSRLGQIRAQVSHRLGTWRITGGGSAEARSIESVSIGDHDDGAAGAFLSARGQFFGKLTASLTGRLDYDPSYGWEPTPQLALAYNVARFTLRGAVGRSVRAPTYTERYLDTQTGKVDGNLGNPALEPERAWSYEAGADWRPLAGVALHATAFARRARNLIDYATVPPNDSLFVAQNIHRTTTRGLELEGMVRRDVGPARLHLTASYTRLGVELGDVASGVEYKYALTAPEQLAQANATFRVGPWSAGAQAWWKDRRQRDSYGIVNLRGGYRLSALTGGPPLTVTGEVRNVFDAEHADIFDAPLPRRWWIVGLRLGG